MIVSVEVPDEVILNDGRRFEPTGEFRHPRPNEACLGGNNLDTVCRSNVSKKTPQFILREVPWRAKRGEDYLYVNSDAQVVQDIEMFYPHDDSKYELGNYCRTRKEADNLARLFRQLCRKHRNENSKGERR